MNTINNVKFPANNNLLEIALKSSRKNNFNHGLVQKYKVLKLLYTQCNRESLINK